MTSYRPGRRRAPARAAFALAFPSRLPRCLAIAAPLGVALAAALTPNAGAACLT